MARVPLEVVRSPVSVSYELGHALGDWFTHKYFSLPEEKRRRWDATRLMHHGAAGQILADASARAAEALPRGPLRRVTGILRAFGEGVAESDRHDEHAWWTDGLLAGTATLVAAAMARRER